jgi:hypothetical protein
MSRILNWALDHFGQLLGVALFVALLVGALYLAARP